MAKKAYSLDYSIYSDTDRMEAVRKILDNLDTEPTPAELDQMALYVLYGKDADGKNAVQRGEVTDANRRYASSYKRSNERLQSLDAIIDNPLSDQINIHDVQERYIYTKPKPTIKRPTAADPIGDSDIPGMVELWDSIDRLAHTIAVNEGKIPWHEGDQLVKNSYQLYQMRHQLIDLRRHQYYLKESYKPVLHFQNIRSNPTPTINFDSDAAYWITETEWRERTRGKAQLDDFETKVEDGVTFVKWIVRHQTFDWENPHHVKCLIDYYSAIYMQDWDKTDSWGRTLIYDFDFYAEKAKLSPLREYILIRRIDRADYPTILQEIQQKFGVAYNESYLCSILTTEIPTAISRAATIHRLKLETPPDKLKLCPHCGNSYPAHPIFFGNSASRPDGLNIYCRACERTRRNPQGDEPKYDRRKKDPTMRPMQAREEFGEFSENKL